MNDGDFLSIPGELGSRERHSPSTAPSSKAIPALLKFEYLPFIYSRDNKVGDVPRSKVRKSGMDGVTDHGPRPRRMSPSVLSTANTQPPFLHRFTELQKLLYPGDTGKRRPST